MSLYIVATPIGNLEDISARAIRILSEVDLIAAEDTRHSRGLMQHFGIGTSLVAYHDHNESKASDSLIQKLQAGQDIALISDAGTPLISDPGYRIVKRALESGIEVIPVPGASAMLAALSVSGLSTDRFQFEGFLSSKTVARRTKLKSLCRGPCTLVFYEAPHRIKEMLSDLSDIFGEDRLASVAREMTKKFEQICQGTLASLVAKIESGEIVSKGEFVVVVDGSREVGGDYDEEQLMSILSAELPPRKAASIAHKLTGAGKRHLYDIALSLKDR